MEAPTVEDELAPEEATSVMDWSELPLDALASVFGKLGAIEILMSAGLVCRSWLVAAMVPELWRSVVMAHKVVENMDYDALTAMAKVAVDRSGGQLEVFVGKLFVTDELLKYIGDRSPAMKAVGLISCEDVSNEGFTEVVAKCPLLEDLMLLQCDNQLGSEALGVATMHGLRSLALIGTNITNDELAFVLDSCPHLEVLDLRGCFKIVVDDALRARCAAIKSLMLPR
ncbi:hypothetical protein HU200_005063 [Digitaria exilis]|uniref:F-box domain-containing protein n=1 Tax=Digitaria exilis TaxID=1010633 RepID=A0A835FUQ7_9POAL|nr:hypothetical protein HU200_005063 [Digitaria exilis]